MDKKLNPENASSPAYSSDSNDQEFTVTAEMMIDGEDYENTLDEEEEMDDVEDEDELADLQKEGEMPLEDLLKMYYGGNTEENNVTETETGNSEKLERGKDDVEATHLSLDVTGVNENGDAFDPFFNQRVTRGLAALNSQYFDEDYSSDEDYQPAAPADDWKKEIQQGEEYQAVVEEGLNHYKPDEKTCDMDDKLLWKPAMVTPAQLKRYLSIVYKLTDGNTQSADRDDEQALFTLVQMKDVEKALAKRQDQDKQPPEVSLWSEEECQNFEQGLRVFGKDFRLIQKNKVQTRGIGEIVQFYYLWKKTERHDAFVTQTKLGRRKYSLPGIADMMGRFMEETDSMFSSRSASPNVDAQTSAQQTHTDTTANIKQELRVKSTNTIKEETDYTNYVNYSNHNETYYDAAEYDRTIKRNGGNTTTESWRTSPKPISIGSAN